MYSSVKSGPLLLDSENHSYRKIPVSRAIWAFRLHPSSSFFDRNDFLSEEHWSVFRKLGDVDPSHEEHHHFEIFASTAASFVADDEDVVPFRNVDAYRIDVILLDILVENRS